MAENTEEEQEALRLKTLAEQNYNDSNLKSALKYAKRAHRLHPNLDGLAEMLTAFKILRAGAKAATSTAATPDWYKILQAEPFSHHNTIKKQYKKLALTLHPDKTPFAASAEAFKLVAEAFRVLSDKIRRKEYDMKLRMALQAAADTTTEAAETFWTACSACRLLHQFERRYLGHSLMCPNCKKGFKAVEVSGDGEEDDRVGTRASARIRVRRGVEAKRKMSSVGEVLERSKPQRIESVRNVGVNGDSSSDGDVNMRLRSKRVETSKNVVVNGGLNSDGGLLRSSKRVERYKNVIANRGLDSDGGVNEGLRSKRVERSRNVGGKGGLDSDGGVNGGVRSKRVVERLRNVSAKKGLDSDSGVNEGSRLNRVERSRNVGVNWGSDSDGGVNGGMRSKRVERSRNVSAKKGLNNDGGVKEGLRSKSKRAKIGEETMTLAEMQLLAKRKLQQKAKSKGKDSMNEKESMMSSEIERPRGSKSRSLDIEGYETSKSSEDLEGMAVEDSDFYDFDRDRMEKSFKKGQVWAVYDDGDGMPRHYGLIDEVVSVNPFEVKMSWLDLQSNGGDEGLICSEKMGFHISCGRFKVSRKTSIDSLNVFSHTVDCERAAREVYRIYPKKGSIWALYNDNALDGEGANTVNKDRRCYDIVIFLTSYSEMHGLSMAYLEKVSGFRTVFKRREIGGHAIRWLEKDEVRLFSHEIPARKLSGVEASDLSKDCWELDPASLPPELLTIN